MKKNCWWKKVILGKAASIRQVKNCLTHKREKTAYVGGGRAELLIKGVCFY